MSSPQKILLYTDTPLYGGAEKQLLLLAKNLPKNQYLPIVVGRQSADLQEWYKDLQKAGIKTIIIHSADKNSASNYWQLSKIIKAEKPALLHAHIWNPVACKFAYLAALRWHIPLVTTEHDPFALRGHRRIFKKLVLSVPKKIITVSKANRLLMSRLYPHQAYKITTVYNGIEKSRTHLDEVQILRIKKEIFAASPQTRIVFSAGALHPRKGYKYLISAFKKISGKIDNLKLIIAGSGPEKAALEKLIKNLSLDKKVLLLGQRNDIDKLMQAGDIFVLPSLKEAFGLVILEAMQNGLPVIASDVGGIPEIIETPDQGILIPPANKNELVKSVSTLLTHPELAEKLRQNGLKRWLEFSADKMARNTEAVYYQTLNT
jgi:glycosyltransferase involved in cell wall biosynthesis